MYQLGVVKELKVQPGVTLRRGGGSKDGPCPNVGTSRDETTPSAVTNDTIIPQGLDWKTTESVK